MSVDINILTELSEAYMQSARILQADASTRSHHDVAIELGVKAACYATKVRLLMGNVAAPSGTKLIEHIETLVRYRSQYVAEYPEVKYLIEVFTRAGEDRIPDFGYASSLIEYNRILEALKSYIEIINNY